MNSSCEEVLHNRSWKQQHASSDSTHKQYVGGLCCFTLKTSQTLTSLCLFSPLAGRPLHVRREAGGEVGQRDGRDVGVQHPQAHLVAAETDPASSLRPGGAHGPRGGAGRRRAGDADLLWLLADLQLRQQSPGVQHQ